jgi:heme/copper-type cytochrome/quinol oxidase subunit 2
MLRVLPVLYQILAVIVLIFGLVLGIMAGFVPHARVLGVEPQSIQGIAVIIITIIAASVLIGLAEISRAISRLEENAHQPINSERDYVIRGTNPLLRTKSRQ